MSGIPSNSTYIYLPGSGLEVPGIEARLEYGDATGIVDDHIPGALLINDRSMPDQVHVTDISGLHDDPDGRDSRINNADRHGERAGLMLYSGRTIGLTGRVQSGNVYRMRDLWRTLRSQFGTVERDLLIHPPEVQHVWRNEVVNPDFLATPDKWFLTFISSGSNAITGVADGDLSVARFALTGATGAGQYQVSYGRERSEIPWSGEDIYLRGLVKIDSATATVTSVEVGFYFTSILSGGQLVLPASATQSSPVTGTWYDLSARITGDQVRSMISDDYVSNDQLTPTIKVVFSNAGNVTTHLARFMCCLLDPSDPTPPTHVTGSAPGDQYDQAGRSFGPVFAVNRVSDARLENAIVGAFATWTSLNSASVTVVQAPTATSTWAGVYVPRSLYYKATKDSGATSRNIGLRAVGGLTSGAHEVAAGSTWRLSGRANVVGKPASGTLEALLVWRSAASTEISRVSSGVIPSGVSNFSVSGTAPVGATGVDVVVQVTGTTTSSAALELMITDVALVEQTYQDVDPFWGYGDPTQEVGYAGGSIGVPTARRRLPRPFLVRGVRKTSDMKAPEQQVGLQYRRSFTMSLRASDPRIYVLDERSASIRLAAATDYYSEQSPENFTLETAGPPAPTGWTYVEHNITNPGGAAAPYKWSRQIDYRSSALAPNGGVSFKSWESGGYAIGAPAASITPRMYRSAEGFTYTTPRVVLGCAPSMADASSGFPDVMSWVNIGGSIYMSRSTIVLKRVSSTTWLELRWNSVSNVAAQPSSSTTKAFELWCSHNTAGTLATTRLAAWDYASYDSSNGRYPFVPMTDPQYLVCWMDASNNVHWELWRSYPSLYDTNGRYELGSYALPAGLQPVIGAGVAAQVGRSMTIEQSSSGAATFAQLAGFPPFWHYYEMSKSDVPPVSATVPVIGSMDTPQRVTLMGDIVNPVLTFAVPNEDGTTENTVARFIGTATDANPVTVDLATGQITDALGVNRYSMLQPGSRFPTLRPGKNTVTLTGSSWNAAASAHLIMNWRDALA